jgi:hypothetical protein
LFGFLKRKLLDEVQSTYFLGVAESGYDYENFYGFVNIKKA